ncbi:hypothetical protein HL657_07820 [Methanoculleus sp. YWC-01]|uniref:Uncharacterized protein n=1 Tax=Methanoculleus nereidis TaxID=2735141 RepID=A0ABU3Z2N1_9EURY|nr:hypothetical protein [Methanoculleus sp. YWC-01]MDV4343077.1 hypothetical protein [Methanoculleus sp. YWC-01]
MRVINIPGGKSAWELQSGGVAVAGIVLGVTYCPVARLSMMTTSWFCARVSARFEPSRPRR